MMALEMELCALLLETLDTRVLGPPKMQSKEEGCRPQNGVGRFVKQVLKKKVKKGFFKKPNQNELVASGWPTQSQWINCPPSKMGLI
jgi:hypothetical protein